MNMQPLISIIIPVYNSEKFILKTLQSIIDQNYPNWEAICIDDCSSDESVILIEKLMKKDERIKLIKNELNYGPAKSRNIGLHYSKGEYITFLDSDDFWNKNKLKLQYEFMIKKDIDFSFTAYDLVNLYILL